MAPTTTTRTRTKSSAATPPAADPPAPEDESDLLDTPAPAPEPQPFIPDLVVPDDHDWDAKPKGPKPTHFLALACGHRVAELVPVASHHFCEEDGVTVPVVGRFPYPPAEDD